MSSDDIEFERGGDGDTSDVLQDNVDETIKDDDQSMTTATTTTTSQQALKQLNQLTSNNSNSSGTKVTATTVASTSAVGTSNLQKIEPKLTIPGAKIVYIKNPNGTQQSIRIGGSLIGGNQSVSANNSNSNANATSSTIQKVQLLQLKNKNVVSSSAVPAAAATSTNNNQPRFVLKPGCAPPARFIISSSGGAAAKISSAGTSGSNTRTITVQQMGLIVPSNKTTGATTSTSSSSTTKTPILPASTSSSTSASSSAGGANIALKNQPTILNKGVKPIPSPQKILIQSDSGGDGSESKTKSPGAPNIVKVAGTGQQVRVLQGKGLQYVRVLNAIPSGNANTSTATTTSKIVNGRQQQVIVQRKLVPQPGGTQISTAGGKPQQFVTKKLEVMPIGSTTKIIKKDSSTGQAVKTPTTFLLNNVQKNIVTSSIDIKPVTSNQSDSFEITEVKDEPSSPSNTLKKFTSRTYSLSTDRKSKSPEPNQSNLMYSTLKLPSPEPIEGIRRKHCNCTKSQCLKLYCDCFANGEFCSNCNCKECFNTLEKEDERQKAIKICLERNPHAFKPKIGKARDQSDTLRRHTKGCNCKRSGCLKNYCECYEAKIVCSANCKCIGCRNIDDHMDNNDRDNSHYEVNQTIKRTYEQRDEKIKTEPIVPAKKPCNFITPDVIEATVQCIIAQADDCLKNDCDAKASERKILEEFGRCLVEIIEFSKKNNENADE